MKKIFSFLFVALFSVSLWAGTSSTFYFAISAETVGSNCNNVQFNVKNTDETWYNPTMTKQDASFGGKLVYKLTYEFPTGAYYNWQFMNNTSLYREIYGGSANSDLHNGEVYDYDANEWKTYTADDSYIIYFVNYLSWTDADVKAYAYNSDCDINATWAGAEAASVAGKTYGGKQIHKIVLNKRFSKIIFNNGSGGEGNQTADLDCYANAGKMYDGSNWIAYTEDPVTVTFNNNGHGGEAPAAQSPNYFGKATVPTPAPTDDDYAFMGWYTSADCSQAFDFDGQITKDTTLYARWLGLPTVVLSYDSVVNTKQIFLKCSVTDFGGVGATAADITEAGFYLGEMKYSTSCKDGDEYIRYIADLAAGTTYNVKAYAINAKGESVSAIKAITTRAAATNIIRVRIPKDNAVPYVYGFTETNYCGAISKTESHAWPGEAMTIETTGNSYKWYTFALSNEFNYFIVSENGSNQTYDFRNPLTDECYWYDSNRANEMSTLPCVTTTPQLMLETAVESGDYEYYDMTVDGNTLKKSITISAVGDYRFKIVYNREWYGKNATMTRANNTTSGLSELEETNIVLTADKAGAYTFTFDPSNSCYLSIEFPTATALDNATENASAIKRIENGQLVIIKNGVKYNALGAEVK